MEGALMAVASESEWFVSPVPRDDPAWQRDWREANWVVIQVWHPKRRKRTAVAVREDRWLEGMAHALTAQQRLLAELNGGA